ncbi:hypothetical protein ACFL1I_03560 [Candidatus Omnitrophota bacterium]
MDNKGLSLAEVMVASVLIALTTGLVLNVFTQEMGTVAMSGRRIEAFNLCAQTQEHLKYEVAADTWPGGSLSAGIHAAEPFLSLVGTDLGSRYSGTRTYAVTDQDPNGSGSFDIDEYKQITVTVGWTEP